jgi:hypothetical protein
LGFGLKSKMEMKAHNLFTAVFVILAMLVIWLFWRDRLVILQGFATETEIKTELAKQVQMLNEFNEFKKPDDMQPTRVMPNMEIIHKFRANAKSLLGPIEETVKKDTAEKQAELDKLNEYIDSLNEYARQDFFERINKRDIRTVKSHNNGLELAVSKTTTGPAPNYQVRVNGGCLKVPWTNDATVVPCNSGDSDQIFSLDNVFNEPGYRAKMDPAYPQLQDLGQVRYPFSVLRAKSNGNCLKNYHGSLSVEPCREYEGQRWAAT